MWICIYLLRGSARALRPMCVYTYLREVSACCSFYRDGQCESLNERNEQQGKALTLFFILSKLITLATRARGTNRNMKKLLKTGAVALALLASPPLLEAASPSIQTLASAWYDIDGDGKLEFIDGNEYIDGDKIYRLDDNGNTQVIKTLNTKLRKPKISRLSANLPLIVINRGKEEVYSIQKDYSLKQIQLPAIYTNDYYKRLETYYYPADFRGDGSLGIISHDKYGDTEFKIAYTLDADGNYQSDELSIITWNEYKGIRSKLVLSDGGGMPSVAQGMFVGSNPGTSYGDLRSLDLNGDGLSDIFDAAGGRYYLNTGLGSFVQNTFGGKVTVRDLNADGIVDFVVFDKDTATIKAILSDGPDSSREVELLKGFYCNDRIWCYDFDNDGDIDILVPIDRIWYTWTSSSSHDNGGAFLVYFENDGKGNFKKCENWIDDTYVRFFDCLDFDADGKYEILASKMQSDYDIYELCFYEVPGRKISNSAETFYTVTQKNSCRGIVTKAFNLDNSGQTIITCGNGDVWINNEFYHPVVYTTEKINQRPNAPGKPQYMFNQEEGTLKVFWEAATDAETPTADLTYELRVGTAPGLDDIVAADALPDGRRRTMSLGANGHQLYRTFNVSGWPAGKYYISVQAVDPNMLGSEFSEAAVFDKKLPATNFAIDAPDILSVNDEIALRLIGTNKQAKDVTWNLDGGEMLSANADKSECKIRFTAPGRKNISVAVTGANGVRSISKERSLEIRNAKVDTIGNGPLESIIGVFDLDADGSEEFLIPIGSQSKVKFIEQNDAGELNQVRKMYNTNLDGYRNVIPVDINRDGLVDFLSDGSWYYYLWNNNDDKDLDISEKLTLADSYDKSFVDMNNDGKPEAIFNNSGHIAYLEFSDDMKENTLLNIYSLKYYIHAVEDYNGDGLPDLFTKKNDEYLILYNKGGMTFSEGEKIPKYNDVKPTLIGDFDHDGKLDVLYSGYRYGQGSVYDESITICYGNGRIVEVQCPDGDPFGEIIGVFDFDNNGMDDFMFYLKNSRHDQIIYMNQDYSYNSSDAGIDGSNSNCIFHRNDGGTYTLDRKIYNISNERPTAPGEIRHSVNEEFVNIEWSAASDKETPAGGLKYNISVKKKGAEGEGAYLLSPMNMGRDNVSVPSGHRLLNAPRIAIPLSSIPAGEYEVKVQAVDGQRVTGPFSQVYTMTVPKKAVLDAPASALTGEKVTVRLIGNIASPEFDFGPDATVVKSEFRQSYDAVWTESGMKTLKVNGETVATLMVYDAPEADFTLPAEIYEGAKVNVECPTAQNGTWEIVCNGKESSLDLSPRTSGVKVADGKIVFTVTGREDFTIRHIVTESYGRTKVEHTATIISEKARPAIDRVAINASGDANAIYWDANSMPAGTETVLVYRETARINQYELLGSVAAADGMFTDATSLPSIKAARYAISFALPYGESALSEAHQTMHLQLNKGWNGGVNLMWSKYEGRPVISYEIYGGDTEDALQLIESVSGNLTSYTADGTKAYYAVGVVFDDSEEPASRAGAETPRSNVAATADASAVILASGLVITTGEESDEIDLDESNKLQLTAYLTPTGVSVGQIDWYISKGSDLAKVNGNGLVTAYKPGKITVNAATRDGSGISASIDLTITGSSSGVEDIAVGPESNAGGDIMVVSLNGMVVYQGSSDEFYSNIYPRLAKGIYIVKSPTATTNI